ncbi:hypothetical protein ACFO8O_10315 [Hephaestia sp. GCM10023244]|uniref:hypothetical protein n=1 Tax=unclassified Hephaestia TaxID=2631281 RepID=UPI0020772FE5|nr:hypothetical protein [Hephaestia sp. MAHUQ-44]
MFALGGCGQAAPDSPAPQPAETGASGAASGNHIACAPEGAAGFSTVCTLEREGDVLVVRNPDGGFHRLSIGEDGSITAADGAEAAGVTALAGNQIEVMIGGDRYRLPATS